MRVFPGWLLANSFGVTVMVVIAEIDKWNRIARGDYNRPSILQEMIYVRRFLAFAILLGALQVALCYGLTRLIPIRNRVLGTIYGIVAGIALAILGIFPAHIFLSVYGFESLMCVLVLVPIGAVAGALTGRTTRGS